MKEVYEKPTLEVFEFEIEDAIANDGSAEASLLDCFRNEE